MKFSLAICTYRRARALRRLLLGLRAIAELPHEIVVVDSSPDTETSEVISEFGDLPIVYYRVGKDLRGLTRQRNYAAEKCSGDVIIFFDDDVIPAPDFFTELKECWLRHPDASGIGGYIVDQEWRPRNDDTSGLSWFCVESWARRESLRWRVRRVLGLVSDLPPGWMPPEGHGRPSGSYPPDGKDRRVEFVIGCVSSWKAGLVREVRFSHYFEGYGLYEDLDFCIRAGRRGPIYLCTRAAVRHEHDSSGRPTRFKYGWMVVRNGWYVWRQRWPLPTLKAKMKWWLITLLLTALRAPQGVSGFTEACGRLAGALHVLVKAPEVRER